MVAIRAPVMEASDAEGAFDASDRAPPDAKGAFDASDRAPPSK